MFSMAGFSFPGSSWADFLAFQQNPTVSSVVQLHDALCGGISRFLNALELDSGFSAKPYSQFSCSNSLWGKVQASWEHRAFLGIPCSSWALLAAPGGPIQDWLVRGEIPAGFQLEYSPDLGGD